MELHEWLDGEKGRAKWLAAKLGSTPSAVSQWRDDGVPLKFMQQVADLTAGTVTVEKMVAHAASRRAEKKAA